MDKHLRGHWLDRLPAIDDDIADMEKRLERANPAAQNVDRKLVAKAIHAVLTPPPRPHVRCDHTPPAAFRTGQPVVINLALSDVERRALPVSLQLRYRRVNQAELWRETAMHAEGAGHRTVIPGDYTESVFPLQYFFVLRDAQGRAWFFPGFNADLSNQPYFVLRQERRTPA